MTTVRPLSQAPAPPPPNDMTRVRPPGMEIAGVPAPRASQPQISSPRVSIPTPGEINRQVKRKRNGMVALYWAAGIVAMLTAGGIVTAMIARGDADALIQHRGATPSPSIVVVVPPTAMPNANAAPAATGPVAPATTTLAAAPTPPNAAETAAKTEAPAKKGTSAIPGTKPGQIVDLQLWRNRPAKSGDGAQPSSASPAPAPQAQTTPATTTQSNGGSRSTVATPENDPAVRLARDQLESSFK